MIMEGNKEDGGFLLTTLFGGQPSPPPHPTHQIEEFVNPSESLMHGGYRMRIWDQEACQTPSSRRLFCLCLLCPHWALACGSLLSSPTVLCSQGPEACACPAGSKGSGLHQPKQGCPHRSSGHTGPTQTHPLQTGAYESPLATICPLSWILF